MKDLAALIKAGTLALLTWISAHRKSLEISAALLVVLYLLAGNLVPFAGESQTCYQQLLNGDAPSTLWRWNPWVLFRIDANRKTLLARAQNALSLGQPLDAAASVAPDLAWANACRPKDPQVAALLVWAAYYQAAKVPNKSGLGDGLRAVGARCGINDMDGSCLLDALSAAGVLDPAQEVKAFDALGKTLVTSDPVYYEARPLESGGIWAFEQELAFSEFRYQPTNLARLLPDIFKYPVPPEQERARLAQLSVIQTWEYGVTAAAQVLSVNEAKDPWLAAVAPNMGFIQAAKGKEMDDLGRALKIALIQPGTAQMDGMVQSGLQPATAIFELNWEGWIAVDQDGSKLPELDLQAWIKQWGATARALPAATVIEPPVQDDGSLAPLSGALAVLANDASSDLPQLLWSGLRVKPVLDDLGAFVPEGPWDDGQGLHFQERLAAAARLKCRMSDRPDGLELSASLVRDGQESPWVKKIFRGRHLIEAPNWLASQALRLSGFKIPLQDKKVLARPLFKTPADLREFAEALGGHNPTYGQVQWYERLYQRDPSMTLLDEATVGSDYGGTNRWDLVQTALQSEPWNWQAQMDYAYHLLYMNQRIKALRMMQTLLEQDPGQIDVLRKTDQILRCIGYVGERTQLADAALSITGRTADMLVLAANIDDSRSWDWRGTGWGKDSSTSGRLFMQMEERRGKALALEARTKDVEYAPTYTALLDACTLLEDPDSEKDEYLRAASLVDPNYDPPYEERLLELMPKWGGTPDGLIAFGRNWGKNIWYLPIETQSELENKKQEAVWDEIRDIYLAHLKACPWDMVFVEGFGSWALESDKEKEGLTAISTTLWSIPSLAPWVNSQIVAFLDGMAEEYGHQADELSGVEYFSGPEIYLPAFYSKNPDYLDERIKAEQALCVSYPKNLDFLNDLASLSWRVRQQGTCAWAMERLQNQREDSYWSSQEFAQAQAWLASLNTHTHV